MTRQPEAEPDRLLKRQVYKYYPDAGWFGVAIDYFLNVPGYDIRSMPNSYVVSDDDLLHKLAVFQLAPVSDYGRIEMFNMYRSTIDNNEGLMVWEMAYDDND